MADSVEETPTIDVNISEEEDVLPPEDDTQDEDSFLEQPTKEENEDQSSSEEKTKPGEESEEKVAEVNIGWVDIIEKENNLKLLSELNKIGKLITMKDKVKEYQDYRVSHRICLAPIYPEDLVDPYMTEVMKLCATSQVFFLPEEEGEESVIQGVLELKFRKISDLMENKDKLGQIRENIQVGHNLSMKDYEKFVKKWRMYGRSVEDDKNKLTLFAPSLPESVTEAEMWDLFPSASEIALISGSPRQHAYVMFKEEDTLKSAIKELKARGPPRPDFNFCRLVRFSKIVDIINEDKKLKKTQKQRPAAAATSQISASSEGPRNRAQNQRRNQAQRQPRRNTANRAGENGRPGANDKPTTANKKAAPKGKEDVPNKKPGPQGKPNTAAKRANEANKRTPGGAGAQRRGNWYRDRRAKHLEQARRQGRNAPRRPGFTPSSPRIMDDRQQGLQMLDTLLTSLGQLSSSGLYPGQTPNVGGSPNTRDSRPRGPNRDQRPSRSSSGRRGGSRSLDRNSGQMRGGQSNNARNMQGQQNQEQRTQQNRPASQQNQGFGQQQQSPGQGARRRQRRKRGRGNASAGSQPDRRQDSGSRTFTQSSPIKRTYPSMESLPRPDTSSMAMSMGNKRRRDNFDSSYGADSSLDAYRPETRRTDTSYSSYNPDYSRRSSYGISSYDRLPSSSNDTSDTYKMLAALDDYSSRNTAPSRSMPTQSRYNSSSYNQLSGSSYNQLSDSSAYSQMPSSSSMYDRSSYY